MRHLQWKLNRKADVFSLFCLNCDKYFGFNAEAAISRLYSGDEWNDYEMWLDTRTNFHELDYGEVGRVEQLKFENGHHMMAIAPVS